jgi:hypothetical protein
MKRPGIIALTVAVAMGLATASFAQSGGAGGAGGGAAGAGTGASSGAGGAGTGTGTGMNGTGMNSNGMNGTNGMHPSTPGYNPGLNGDTAGLVARTPTINEDRVDRQIESRTAAVSRAKPRVYSAF